MYVRKPSCSTTVILLFNYIIDRLVPVPSVFFIGHFGQPIAIVAGTIPSVEGFEERIALAEKEFHQPKTESSSSTTAPPQPTTPQNVAGHSSKATGTTKSSVEQSQVVILLE